MKYKLVCFFCLAMIAVSFLAPSCTKEGEYRCENTSPNRVGARCKDGTRTDVVGSGACSGRGGVDYWICRN